MNDSESHTFPCLEMGNCATTRRVPSSETEPKCANPDDMECGSIESSFQKNSASLQCQSSERCFKPQTTSFREQGSLEESFFDSHLSLDSDCEDYFSVNGDVTPAINDTPSRRSIVEETPQLDEDLNTDDATSSRNKTSQNKLLIDLFHESFNSNGLDENQSSHRMPEAKPPNICYLPPKPETKSSYVSMVNFVCNSKRTRKTHSKPVNRKSKEPVKGCLPNLVRNLSFSDKKKNA